MYILISHILLFQDGCSVVQFMDTTLGQYLTNMSSDKCWADHVIISATCRFLGIHLQILSAKGEMLDVSIQASDPEAPILRIGHIPEIHYVGIRAHEDSSPVEETVEEIGVKSFVVSSVDIISKRSKYQKKQLYVANVRLYSLCIIPMQNCNKISTFLSMQF